MASSLSDTLEAHQASGARRPHVLLTARARAFGFHRLSWRRVWRDNNSDVPHAACVTASGALIRARNVAGSIAIQLVTNPADADAAFQTWTTSFASTATGRGLALAAHPSNGEVILVYSRSNTVYFRLSSDNGATWGSETSIVTEASAPAWIAAAYRTSTGNVCLFYNLSADVRRIRRTSGTWAASSTSSGLTVDSVTGIAAVHDGSDFALLITGTESSTEHKRVWAARMGDGGLPANAWSSLTTVAESDADSGLTYHCPSLVCFSGVGYFGTFSASESGDVAVSRAWWTHPAAGASPTSTWLEPAPHEAETGNGLAIAQTPAGDAVYASTPSHVWRAAVGDTADLTSRLLSARVKFGYESTSALFELDDADGLLYEAEPGAGDALQPGHELVVSPGYDTSEGAEYGVSWTLQIDAIRTQLTRDGRRRVTVQASGPWEAAARWTAPQAWQSASGSLTRSALFARVAARIGIPVTADSVPYAPSSTWTSHKPSFAQVEGESGRAALRRLLAPVADIARPDASGGGFAIRNGEDPRWAALMRRLDPDYWWRLHERTGAPRAIDEIAGANLTPTGTPVFGAGGPLADQPTAAATFAGGSPVDVLAEDTAAFLATATNWTLVALARWDGTVTNENIGVVAMEGDGNPGGYGMGVLGSSQANPGNFGAVLEGVAFVDAGVQVTEDEWHLMVMNRDTSTIRFYLDGELAPTTSSSTPTAATQGASIGAEWSEFFSAYFREFHGDVSEVAFFKRALSAGEIAQLQEARDPAQWTLGSGDHPLATATAGAAASPVNWSRVQSADRYADAFDGPSVYRLGPRRRSLRVLDADSDAKATDYAGASLERELDELAGECVVPWHAGLQVGDVVRVDAEATRDDSLWRIAGLELRFERGQRYDALLTLGGW